MGHSLATKFTGRETLWLLYHCFLHELNWVWNVWVLPKRRLRGNFGPGQKGVMYDFETQHKLNDDLRYVLTMKADCSAGEHVDAVDEGEDQLR